MNKKKKFLRTAIIAIPYLLYFIRILITVADEYVQEKTYSLLTYLNLTEQPKTPKI